MFKLFDWIQDSFHHGKAISTIILLKIISDIYFNITASCSCEISWEKHESDQNYKEKLVK